MASPSSFTYCCPPSSSPVWSEPLYSLRPEHSRERLQDDSVETVTSTEQVSWLDWARRPRGGFWERESGPQGRRGAEPTRELQLPQCSAAPPHLWDAPGAQAWAGEWNACGAGWGGVVVKVGGRGQYLGPLCLRERRESCSVPAGLKQPGWVGQPTPFCRTSGGSRMDNALSPPCIIVLGHRGEKKWPDCGHAIP